jgi:signal transduction histidine kinase
MTAIVLIPSAALLVIGLGASGYLVYDGYRAQDWATTMQKTEPPGTQFVEFVAEERRLSLLRLGGDETVKQQLDTARQQLDASLAGLAELASSLTDLNPEAVGDSNKAFQQFVGQLVKIRQGVDAGPQAVEAGQVKVQDIYLYYNTLSESIRLGLQGIAKYAPDPKTAVEESTATVLYDIAEAQSRGHAIAAGGVANGGLSAAEYEEFFNQVGRYRTTLNGTLPILTKDLQGRAGQLMKSPEWQQLTEQESALRARGPRANPEQRQDLKLPLNNEQWQAAATTVNGQLMNLYSEHHRYAEGFAADTGKETFRNSLIGGGAILLFTLIAAFVAARLSNRVVKRMKRLRAETLELADRRLPRMVQRLRSGEQIDINSEVPPLRYGMDELGQVAEAFNKAQRTAVAAAAQEAEIQNGVKAVFLNIAHRSQVVVRRQLEVLDKAEREQEDPDQLEMLFQLDHLSTRARRNAENLIILGGEQPGRQWRNPQPLVEIVRSAIGETEQYRRVNTGRLPDLLIAGTAVADLIHLLAELVDNATAFSPPDSRVEVRGNRVGKGVVIEVEDQGLGLSRDERESINAFLQDPPDFGVMALSEEARLGLFVVSQLAARHGISVTLVDSAYGGIRAIVLVRAALIEMGPAGGPATNGRGGSMSSPSLPGPRHEMSNTPPPGQFTGSGSLPPVHSPGPDSWPNDLSHLAHAMPDDISALSDPTVRWPAQESWPAQQTQPVAQNGAPAPDQITPNGRGNGATPPPSVPPQAPSQPSTDGAGQPVDSRPKLPRRRRQANIAPQLASDAETAAEQTIAEDDSVDLAERARNRMSAFQRGTREGRSGP